MRSVLARIIAITAIIPLIPALGYAFEIGAVQSTEDRVRLTPQVLMTFATAASTPLWLFALACVVEMLFRIAERLPPAETARRGFWRNKAALALLAVAGVYYVVTGVAMLGYFAFSETQYPAETPRWYIGGLSFANWLVEGLVFVAVAAGIEYLSRIADALQKRATQQAG